MNEPTPTTPAVPLLLERYRVVQQVGIGHLAMVYHAKDERLQRDVFVHIIRKELVAEHATQFQATINALAHCSHSALLQVYDSSTVAERPYMITEYVTGRPLKDMGTLSIAHALSYTHQVAEAIAQCIARGVSHPPVSSNTLLLIDDNTVKLVDHWRTAPDASPYNSALDLAHYRAPEMRDDSPSTPTAMVYALGILLYELITGTRPITITAAIANDVASIVQAHQHATIPPLIVSRPMIHMPALQQLITRATARFPEQRIPDCNAFCEMIARLTKTHTTDTQRLSYTPTFSSPRQNAHTRQDVRPTAPPAPAPVSPAPAPVSPAPAPHSPPRRKATHNNIKPIPPDEFQRKSLGHSVAGWMVMLIMLLVVALGSYLLASVAVDKLFAIQLPQPSFADLGMTWPDWLPGQTDNGEVLVVNISGNEGLNLRDTPGINTNVVATIANGTLVTKLSDNCVVVNQTLVPCVVDDVQWVQVRAPLPNGSTIDGWMSTLFLQPSDAGL